MTTSNFLTALDLVNLNVDSKTAEVFDVYKRAAKIMEDSNIALGRKTTFKTTVSSATSTKVNLDAAITTTR